MRPFQGLSIHFDENALGATATVDAPAAAAPVAEGPTIQERWSTVKKAGGRAREHLALHGDLAGAEALLEPKSDVTAASSSVTPSETPETAVEIEAASEPAVEEQPPAGETPEQKSERKRRNDTRRLRDMHKIELELATERTKRELLEKQIAESKGASAPPKTEDKPADSGRPRRPRLKDFDGPDGLEKYEAAMDTYETAVDQWNSLTQDQRESTRTQTQQFQHASEKWESTKTAARVKYKDFDAVAFNPKTPASLPQIVETQAREDAAEIMYYLGKHPDVSDKIAELTDIPATYGTFAKWSDVEAAMAKNPNLAYLIGEKRGLAKAEIARIGESLKKTTAPSKAKDLAEQPKPSGEVAVEPRGTPTGNDLADIIKRAAAGDKAAAREYKRRWREQELQELGHN